MNILVPLILVATSIGLFFGYTKPTYDSFAQRQEEQKALTEALGKVSDLKTKVNSLSVEYNKIETEDIERLNKLIPDSNDSVATIITLQKLASERGVSVTDINIGDQNKNTDQSDTKTVQQTRDKNQALISFKARSTYGNLVSFIEDVEQNLRLIEIDSINVVSGQESMQKGYEVNMALRVKWFERNN